MLTLWISARKGYQHLPWDMEAEINFIFLNHTVSSCNGCLLRPRHVNILSLPGVVLPQSSEPLDVQPTLHMEKTSLGNTEELFLVEIAEFEPSHDVTKA